MRSMNSHLMNAASSHTSIVAGGSLIVFVAIPLFLGWVSHRTSQIRGPALAGTARILSVEQTSQSSDTSLVLRIGLMVEVPGQQPYEVTVKPSVQLIHLARVQPGATIPVQVDATNPQKVLIDFNQLWLS